MANDTDKLENARNQARSQFESIAEMVAAMNRAREIADGEFDWEEEAERLGFTSNDDGEWSKPGFCRDAKGNPPSATECFDDPEEACRAVESYPDEDEARQHIEEDALSVQVRSGWHSVGEKLEPAEFEILLCTGGPAVRIMGELGDHNEPERAWLECQDWFTPWTRVFDVEQDTLLAYARTFYFGEG